MEADNLLLLLFKFLLVLTSFAARGGADESVHIRSDFGQLVTSDTLRWTKHLLAKEPVQANDVTLCRLVSETREVGGLHNGQCHVIDLFDKGSKAESDQDYQVLSGHAAQVTWVPWKRPSQPPEGAVASAENKNRFVALHPGTGAIGYLDYSQNLGSCAFPAAPGVDGTQCLVLKEIVPERYELSVTDVKKSKSLQEKNVTLVVGSLERAADSEDEEESSRYYGGEKEKVAKVLSYVVNQYDYWGQGQLMAKGLHTAVKLPANGGTKIIEWGIASTESNKEEDITVSEELAPGTGVNITVKGLHMKGYITYSAKLITVYKDKSTKVRHIEDHRKVDRVDKVFVEKGPVFSLRDGSVIPEPTTTTTSTTTAAPTEPPAEYKEDDRHGLQESSLPQPGEEKLNGDTPPRSSLKSEVSTSASSPIHYTFFAIVPTVLIVIRTLVSKYQVSG